MRRKNLRAENGDPESRLARLRRRSGRQRFWNYRTQYRGEVEIMTTETRSSEAVVIERILNAPIAKVWKALTKVDQMRQWYFDLKEFKPEAGFEFEHVVEHEGNRDHHLGKITEVGAHNKIAYTWR